MTIRTARTVILEVLAENPEGLVASGVEELVSRKHAVAYGTVPVLLCNMVRRGEVERKRGHYGCCFKSGMFYKLRKKL